MLSAVDIDDWDDGHPQLSDDELRELEKTLARLDDCDLGEWDRDFVDDMAKRVGRYERRTHVTGKQWAQIERMKEQYL